MVQRGLPYYYYRPKKQQGDEVTDEKMGPSCDTIFSSPWSNDAYLEYIKGVSPVTSPPNASEDLRLL